MFSFFKAKKPLRLKWGKLYLTKGELIKVVYDDAIRYTDAEYRDEYIQTVLYNYGIKMPMSQKQRDKYISLTIGSLAMIGMVILSIYIPHPTKSQASTFKLVLSLFGAAFGAFIPGLLFVNISAKGTGYNFVIRAIGALAVFVILYFWEPANPWSAEPDRHVLPHHQ